MEKRWLNPTVRAGLALGLLYCVYLVATQAIAYWYFRDGTPDSIRKAIRFDPRNPLYYAQLARVLLYSPEGGDLAEVIRLFEQATRLSPHQARYWAELGGAYELAGRSADALAAYERARQLFPNSPEINWQLANFYLRAGKTGEALPALQKVLLGDPSLRLQAFDLAWRATGDAELILGRMIPPDSGIYFQYLSYLLGKQRIEPAIAAWQQLLALRLSFEPQQAFPYLDALIEQRRVEELAAAWAVLLERFPTRIHRSRFDSNLITNGDFETEILNGGLGWRIRPVEGVVVSVDTLSFFDGARSLKLRFDGQHNVNYHHVQQYILVQPETAYRFTAYGRAQEITTDSGLRFELRDAYDTSRLLLATENIIGSSGWAPQQFEFKTPRETRLLLLSVLRPPSRKFDNRIAGTLWIDRLSLTAIE